MKAPAPSLFDFLFLGRLTLRFLTRETEDASPLGLRDLVALVCRSEFAATFGWLREKRLIRTFFCYAVDVVGADVAILATR